MVAEVSQRRPHRARRMRPLSPLWRNPGSDAGRYPGDAGAPFARARSAGLASCDAAPALPATRWIARCSTLKPRPAASAFGICSGARRHRLHHRLHDLACIARGDGGGDRQGRAPAAAQDQARRRRRWRADRGGAEGGARIRTHRRCQRGVDIGQSRAKSRAPAREPASRWSNSRCRPARTRRWHISAGPSPSAPTKACMTARSLEGLRERYDAVNIKLDKTGGLTEALAMADAARALGFEIMVGCMVATSLAMAPAMLLTPAGPLRRSRRPAAAGRATATMDCATTAARSIRPRPRCGDDAPRPMQATSILHARQPHHSRA